MIRLIKGSSYWPLLFIFPLLRNADISYLMLFFSIYSIHNIVKQKSSVQLIPFIKLLIPIIILILSAFYKIPDKFDIGYYNSILFYPLVLTTFLPFEKFTKKEIDNSLKIFVTSVGILSFIIVCYILIYNDLSFVLSSNLNGSNIRMLVENIPYFNNSPIYLSIFILISLVIIFENKQFNLSNPLVFLIVLFFNIFLLILFSKTQILIYIVYSSFKIISYLRTKSNYFKFLALLCFAFVVFIVFYNVPFIYNRLIEMYIFAKMPEGLSTSSTSIRLAILKCSLDSVYSSPIFGVGLLNLRNTLDVCFGKFNTVAFTNSVFFTHNQFLFYFVSTGFIGFTIFISFLLDSLNRIRKNNPTIFIIMCVIVGSMFTEDIFLRQKGITIFATFLCLSYNYKCV